jgi:hypothetical protein
MFHFMEISTSVTTSINIRNFSTKVNRNFVVFVVIFCFSVLLAAVMRPLNRPQYFHAHRNPRHECNPEYVENIIGDYLAPREASISGENVRPFKNHEPRDKIGAINKVMLHRNCHQLPPCKTTQQKRGHVCGNVNRTSKRRFLFVLSHPIVLKEIVTD